MKEKNIEDKLKFEISQNTLQSSKMNSLSEFNSPVGETMTKRLVTLGEKELLAKQLNKK